MKFIPVLNGLAKGIFYFLINIKVTTSDMLNALFFVQKKVYTVKPRLSEHSIIRHLDYPAQQINDINYIFWCALNKIT